MDGYSSPDANILKMMARRVAALTRSHDQSRKCKRKAVATVVWFHHDGGWHEFCQRVNGPMADDPDRCADDVGNCGCVHSEFKAICHVMRAGTNAMTRVMVVSYSPCTPCANLIVESKCIDEVYWLEDTAHDMRGIEILRFGRLKGGKIEHD